MRRTAKQPTGVNLSVMSQLKSVSLRAVVNCTAIVLVSLLAVFLMFIICYSNLILCLLIIVLV